MARATEIKFICLNFSFPKISTSSIATFDYIGICFVEEEMKDLIKKSSTP